MPPKIVSPPTRPRLMRMAGTPNRSSARNSRAIATGPPTTSAMKIVRRDQSISPTDRLNTRKAAVGNDGPRLLDALTVDGSGLMSGLDQILEHRLQIVVGRGHLANLAQVARRRQLGEPRVERVGLNRLDDDRLGVETQAPHVVIGQEAPRERARIGGGRG